jgi:hypothetical protein
VVRVAGPELAGLDPFPDQVLESLHRVDVSSAEVEAGRRLGRAGQDCVDDPRQVGVLASDLCARPAKGADPICGRPPLSESGFLAGVEPVDPLADERQEKPLLVAEVVVEDRRRDVGLAQDAPDGSRGIAPGREQANCRLEQAFSPTDVTRASCFRPWQSGLSRRERSSRPAATLCQTGRESKVRGVDQPSQLTAGRRGGGGIPWSLSPWRNGCAGRGGRDLRVRHAARMARGLRAGDDGELTWVAAWRHATCGARPAVGAACMPPPGHSLAHLLSPFCRPDRAAARGPAPPCGQGRGEQAWNLDGLFAHPPESPRSRRGSPPTRRPLSWRTGQGQRDAPRYWGASGLSRGGTGTRRRSACARRPRVPGRRRR